MKRDSPTLTALCQLRLPQDMLLVGGENVYPTELENVLAAHPAVQQAAVFGAPNAVLGELPHACVTLQPGFAAPSAAELLGFCRANLSGYKVPVAVHILDSFPVTGSGKVQKRALRELMLKKLGIPLDAVPAAAAVPAGASAAKAAAQVAAKGGVKAPGAASAPARMLRSLAWAAKTAQQELPRSTPGQRWLVLADAGGVSREMAMAAGARATLVTLPEAPAAASGSWLLESAAATLRSVLTGADAASAPAVDCVLVAWPLDWAAPLSGTNVEEERLEQQVSVLSLAISAVSTALVSRGAKIVFLTHAACGLEKGYRASTSSGVFAATWEAFQAGCVGASAHLHIDLPSTWTAAVTVVAAKHAAAAQADSSQLCVALRNGGESSPEAFEAVSSSISSTVPQTAVSRSATAHALLGEAECLVVLGDWEVAPTAGVLAAELLAHSASVKSVLLLRSATPAGDAERERSNIASAAIAAKIVLGLPEKRVTVATVDIGRAAASAAAQLRLALQAAASSKVAILRVLGGRGAVQTVSEAAAGSSALEAALRRVEVQVEASLSIAISIGVGSAAGALLRASVASERSLGARAWHVELRSPLEPASGTKGAWEILSALESAAVEGSSSTVLVEADAAALRVASVAPRDDGVVAAPAAAEQQQAAVARKGTDLLRRQIREAIASVLDLDHSTLQDDVELWQSGLNSTLAVSAAAQIQSAVGVELPATLLFDYPTVLGLSVYITDAVRRGETRSTPREARGDRTARRARASVSSAVEAMPRTARPAPAADAVAEAVRAAVLNVLQVEAGAELSAESSLWDHGLSSASAVSIAGALESALGQEMPATLVFDYGTVGELTVHVLSLVGDGRTASAGAPGSMTARTAVATPRASRRLSASKRVTRRAAPPSRDSGRQRIARAISEVACRLLGLEALDVNEPLWSVGLNSLGAVQLSQVRAVYTGLTAACFNDSICTQPLLTCLRPSCVLQELSLVLQIELPATLRCDSGTH